MKLRQSLKEVAEGKAFLLQGGDCAELFDYCSQDQIDAKIKLLLQMSLVLIWGVNKQRISTMYNADGCRSQHARGAVGPHRRSVC